MKTTPKLDTQTIKCRLCFDKGSSHDASYISPGIGVVPSTFCECEKGRELYKAWLALDTTKDQIAKVRKQESDELRKNSGIPLKFASFRIWALEGNPALKDIIERLINQWQDRSGYGLYLWGNVGSGKTTTACIAANEIMVRHLAQTKMVSWSEALGLIKDSFSVKTNHPGKTLLQHMKVVPLLVLDDIHQEKWTEWVQEQLFIIINHRYTHNLPIIITSNYAIEDLHARYGEAIASRLMETCKVIEFTGEDRRQKQRPIF